MIEFLKEKKRVLVIRVVHVLGDERLGFEEIFPVITYGLESENGFDRKSFEDVGDYLTWKKWVVPTFGGHILEEGKGSITHYQWKVKRILSPSAQTQLNNSSCHPILLVAQNNLLSI